MSDHLLKALRKISEKDYGNPYAKGCAEIARQAILDHEVRDDERLLLQALTALEYHTAQTRPIQRTIDAINALRARLK